MSAIVTRQKLVAVLGMMGSAHDGEALAAARTAERMRRNLGTTWDELVRPLSTRRRPDPQDWRATVMEDWRATVAACRSLHPDRLTQWERQFLDGLAGYARTPSPRQLDVLTSIAERVL